MVLHHITLFSLPGFLAVPSEQAPGQKRMWTAWLTCGSMAICALFMVLVRVEYRRLALDKGKALDETGTWFDRAVGCV